MTYRSYYSFLFIFLFCSQPLLAIAQTSVPRQESASESSDSDFASRDSTDSHTADPSLENSSNSNFISSDPSTSSSVDDTKQLQSFQKLLSRITSNHATIERISLEIGQHSMSRTTENVNNTVELVQALIRVLLLQLELTLLPAPDTLNQIKINKFRAETHYTFAKLHLPGIIPLVDPRESVLQTFSYKTSQRSSWQSDWFVQLTKAHIANGGQSRDLEGPHSLPIGLKLNVPLAAYHMLQAAVLGHSSAASFLNLLSTTATRPFGPDNPLPDISFPLSEEAEKILSSHSKPHHNIKNTHKQSNSGDIINENEESQLERLKNKDVLHSVDHDSVPVHTSPNKITTVSSWHALMRPLLDMAASHGDSVSAHLAQGFQYLHGVDSFTQSCSIARSEYERALGLYFNEMKWAYPVPTSALLKNSQFSNPTMLLELYTSQRLGKYKPAQGFGQEDMIDYYTYNMDTDSPEVLNLLGILSLWGYPPHQHQDVNLAYKYFMESSNAGDSIGRSYFGYMTLHGLGCKRDTRKGYELLLQSANRNESFALTTIGLMHIQAAVLSIQKVYEQGINPPTSTMSKSDDQHKQYSKTHSGKDSDKKDDNSVQVNGFVRNDFPFWFLATHTYTGRIFEPKQSLEKGWKYLKQASELGNADAMFLVAEGHSGKFDSLFDPPSNELQNTDLNNNNDVNNNDNGNQEDDSLEKLKSKFSFNFPLDFMNQNLFNTKVNTLGNSNQDSKLQKNVKQTNYRHLAKVFPLNPVLATQNYFGSIHRGNLMAMYRGATSSLNCLDSVSTLRQIVEKLYFDRVSETAYSFYENGLYDRSALLYELMATMGHDMSLLNAAFISEYGYRSQIRVPLPSLLNQQHLSYNSNVNNNKNIDNKQHSSKSHKDFYKVSFTDSNSLDGHEALKHMRRLYANKLDTSKNHFGISSLLNLTAVRALVPLDVLASPNPLLFTLYDISNLQNVVHTRVKAMEEQRQEIKAKKLINSEWRSKLLNLESKWLRASELALKSSLAHYMEHEQLYLMELNRIEGMYFDEEHQDYFMKEKDKDQPSSQVSKPNPTPSNKQQYMIDEFDTTQDYPSQETSSDFLHDLTKFVEDSGDLEYDNIVSKTQYNQDTTRKSAFEKFWNKWIESPLSLPFTSFEDTTESDSYDDLQDTQLDLYGLPSVRVKTRGGTRTIQREQARAAFEWYRLAAKQGVITAHVKLGDMFYDGFGTYVDWDKSIQMYTFASAKAHSQATFNLGYMHQFGQGVPQDFALARRFYKSAYASNLDAQWPCILALFGLSIHEFISGALFSQPSVSTQNDGNTQDNINNNNNEQINWINIFKSMAWDNSLLFFTFILAFFIYLWIARFDNIIARENERNQILQQQQAQQQQQQQQQIQQQQIQQQQDQLYQNLPHNENNIELN